MKITDVLVHPLSMAFEKVKWTAHEPFARAEVTLVEIRTDEGIVGAGEIVIGPQAMTCKMVEMLAPVIKGMDPLGVDDIWKKMFSITNPRPGGIGGWDGLPPPLPRYLRPQFMAAIAGIDIALWDIAGKAANKPVFRLLGGTRTDVFTYAVGGFYEEARRFWRSPTNSRDMSRRVTEPSSSRPARYRSRMRRSASRPCARRSDRACCS